MSTKKTNVYLGVEIKARAWNAKIMLACYLADNGFDVIIGPRDVVERLALDDSSAIFIEKDFFHKRYDFMKELKKRRFLLYSYDEEGLVYISDDFYIDSRTDIDTLSLLEKAFTWGKEENDLLTRAYPDIKEKFIPIGNPRIDFITEGLIPDIYQDEIANISSKYGKYILINSAFSSYGNPLKAAQADNDIYKTHTRFDVWGSYSQLMIDTYKWYDMTFESLVDAIRYISPRVNRKIVIRIHPAETMDKWKELIKLPNVFVVSNYDAFPWIYNAETVIHSNCTTGIEATLMGKNVISYMPYTFLESKNSLPDRVSYSVCNREELLSAINNKRTKNIIESRRIIDDYIYLGDLSDSACKRILSVISNDAESYGLVANKSYSHNFRYRLEDIIYLMRERIMGANRKFPYESYYTFKKREQIIEKTLHCKKLNICQVSNNTFCITKFL